MDKPKAIILIGPSGSGKSTYAKKIGHATVSADDYFMRDGKYCFDARKLSEAHGECLKRFMYLVMGGCDVIVDNTNATIAEVAPYIAIAQAYGFDVIVKVMPVESIETLTVRNVHGVPKVTIIGQFARIGKLIDEWPRHWPAYGFIHID